jgi:uncharacterized membrane protein YdbT with pleckstrin-like domain
MRLVTHGDSSASSVNRFLLPHEQQNIMVRRHPAVLLRPFAEIFIGLVVAGLLSKWLGDNNGGQAMVIVWWAWLLLLVRFVWKVAEWSVDYFVVTTARMLVTSGLITRKVNMMPLGKVTDMSFQRSLLGRLLGYGSFIMESAGQDQAFREVHYLPYPETLYLEVCQMVFPGKGDGDD